MNFNSPLFFVFFPLVVALYYIPQNWRSRKSLLLLASYLFYSAWNPPFILLLWISTAVDWWASRRIVATTSSQWRKAWLLLSVCVNLGLLGFFKYYGFLAGLIVNASAYFGPTLHLPAVDVVLPVGISFYTFQTMSYTIDVYRRRCQPARAFLDFALYVTFFPQLVAGPIVRADAFLPQCAAPPRFDRRAFSWGLCLIVIGLFQKMFLSDALVAPVADQAFARPASLTSLDAWIGLVAFSAQIFLDFSGYSICAVGAALCLGFVLPDNFASPYAAAGFADFWRRWHMSLSSWLRDYLYVPLGGNRQGRWRTHVNLMTTMALGGLWHGASLRFVFWGILHGAFLSVERLFRDRLPAASGGPASNVMGLAARMATVILVCLAWVPFRADSFANTFVYYGRLFSGGFEPGVLSRLNVLVTGGVGCALLVAQNLFRDRTLEQIADAWGGLRWGVAIGVMVLGLVLGSAEARGFIYFQF